MQVQIINQRNEAAYFAVEAVCGKKSAFVTRTGRGTVSVTCNNASHKAWGGIGRTFMGWDDAIRAYKSGEMRAIIQAASNAFDSTNPAFN